MHDCGDHLKPANTRDQKQYVNLSVTMNPPPPEYVLGNDVIAPTVGQLHNIKHFLLPNYEILKYLFWNGLKLSYTQQRCHTNKNFKTILLNWKIRRIAAELKEALNL